MENIIKVSVNKNEQPFHLHDWMELNLVVRGEVTGILNNEPSRLTAGELWLVNREVVHSMEDGSDDLIFIQMHINMEKFNQYIPDIWTVYFKCGPNNDDAVSVAMKNELKGYICDIVNLMDSVTDRARNDNRIIYSCIEILNNLTKGFNLIGMSSGFENKENFNRIWRITDYIFDNCNRKLTLKEVADMEYVSEAYLSKILKKETGRNFEETVSYIRAECSIRYLMETSMSVTDISYECGFSAPRYYNAAFQKWFHCTPAEYRKKIKGVIKYSDNINVNSLIFQEGIAKQEFFELLQQFGWETYLPWETIRINIDMDNLGNYKKYQINSFYKDVVSCKTEDLLRYETIDLLVDCKKQLRIDKIFFNSKDDKGYNTIAKANAERLGFEVVETPEQAVTLSSLFGEYGMKLSQYYKQQILNEIKTPYIKLDEGSYAYEDGEAFKIILFNEIGTREKRFNISFYGMAADAAFVLEKTETSYWKYEENKGDGSENQQGIDIDIIRELSKPHKYIELIDNLKTYLLEEEIESRQMKIIAIRAMHKAV